MTVPTGTEDASGQRPGSGHVAPAGSGPRLAAAPSASDVVGATCPYLMSSGGSWRLAGPSRDHRCAASDPPAPQTTEKQRAHCLSSEHVACSIFRAARASRTATLAGGADPGLVDAADRRRRPLARTAPILLEPPRLVDRVVHLQEFERAPGQLALIALMVVAFAIVALTRLSAGGGPTASPSAPPASAPVIADSSPRPTPIPTPSATASAGPSASSSAGPQPSFRTTYKVKRGDTLLGIARQFSTTTAKIKALNHLASSTIHVGQVLKIP